MKKYIPILAIAIFFTLTRPIYANPISVPSVYNMKNITLPVTYIILVISPFIESLIITITLKWKGNDWYNLPLLYWPIILINAITLTLTQILAIGLRSWTSNQNYIYLAEIFPLVSEYFLLRWLFTRLYKQDRLTKPLSNKSVALITVVANLITLSLGMILILVENLG